MPGQQVKNGKAFEYALAKQYFDRLKSMGVNVVLIENNAIDIARNFYNSFSSVEKKRFDDSAAVTIPTMLKIEPGLSHPNNKEDLLKISLNTDSEGAGGDVRDIVFERDNHMWQIGFSAKNNNDAVKHSRLSSVLDFGKSWVGIPCSNTYWRDIKPIFDYLNTQKKANASWSSLGQDKFNKVYHPLLSAFRKELIQISSTNPCIPEKLVQYLIGRHPFYKIIKDDSDNLVIVKAFNIEGGLGEKIGDVLSRYKIPHINLPTRIVEFDFMRGRENTTLDMILDGGWEISFRIHNASTNVEPSLKFDIQLLGNPPILFTQHLFQD